MKKHILLIFTLFTIIITNIESTTAEQNVYPYYHNQAASDDYIKYFEWDLRDRMVTEREVFEAIAYYNYLTPEGLDCFLMHGNIPSYIDDLIAAGRLPQNYTLGSLGGSNSAYYNYNPNSSTAPSLGQSTTTPVEQIPPVVDIPVTPADPTPTLDESKAGIYVVVNEAVKSYETYNKEAVVDTWVIGTQVDVKGLMSNGYYKVVKAEKEQYIDKGNLVPLDKYEAAWEETERIDSTCGKAGSVTYLNTISSETKTEVLEPLEHDYKIIDQIAPTCTEYGVNTNECTVCGDRKTTNTFAIGHIAETKIVVKEETFFTTEATQTKCALCDEVISTTDAQAKVVNIGVVAGITVVIIAVAITVLKKKKSN